MPRTQRHPEDERYESDAEYHQRVQDQMDEDSWAGRSTVGAEFPTRAIVHDMEHEAQDAPHIYRWNRRRYGDGH
jgi:hypothetical protein